MKSKIEKISYLIRNRTNFLLAFILIGYFLYGIILRIEALDIIRVNEWVSRDFDRAINLINTSYFPYAGPESSHGGRLPGPFLYFLLAVPLFVEDSYESIFLFNCSLNIISLFLFFYVARVYLGFRTAVLSSILFSINLLHIDAVTFPINPSFIFPFIIILFGLFFEFAKNKNPRVLPLILFVITLAIQIHYSAATFLIVPLALAIFLKIKIPFWEISKTVLITLVCLSPFLFYKGRVVEAKIKNDRLLINNPALDYKNLFETITVRNTMNRVSFNIGATPVFNPTKTYKLIQNILNYISIFYLLSYLIYQSRKTKLQDHGALWALLFLFYFPALIYELTNTHASHTWYIYIFLPSINIAKGYFLANIYKHLKDQRAKGLLISLTSVLLLYFTHFAHQKFFSLKHFISSKMEHGYPGLFFKNYNLLNRHYEQLINALGIRPEQFYSHVFYEGLTPYSEYFFNKINKGLNQDSPEINRPLSTTCYYLIRKSQVAYQQKIPNYTNANKRLDLFLNDPTIDILSTKPRELVFPDKRFLRVLLVYEYTPKETQSCYTNSQNIFATSRDSMGLALYSRELSKIEGPMPVKQLTKKEEVGSNGKLISFSRSYIAFNKNWETPFKIDIKYNSEKPKNKLKIKLNYYSFVDPALIFKVNNIDLHIMALTNLTSPKAQWVDFNLLPNNSWRPNYSKLENTFTNHFKWHKEIELDKNIQIMKDSFRVEISWEIEPKFHSNNSKSSIEKTRLSLE